MDVETVIYVGKEKEEKRLRLGDMILPPITHDMYLRKDILDLTQIDGNRYKIRNYRELKNDAGECYKKIVIVDEL